MFRLYHKRSQPSIPLVIHACCLPGRLHIMRLMAYTLIDKIPDFLFTCLDDKEMQEILYAVATCILLSQNLNVA